MLSASFVQICDGMNVNVLFPFLAFMTEDLGYTGHRLGYYAGGLAATFCAAQFCSSMLWGVFSDRYGRKPAVVLGVLGAGLGMAVFGFATTYTQAIIGRALSGFLSGNLGVIKSFLTEITDRSNRARGFSIWSVASTFGNIIGPLIGGYLCNPVIKYPYLFTANSIFATYPYLLPCLVCVVLDVAAAVFCLVVMVESRFKNQVLHDIELAPRRSSPRTVHDIYDSAELAIEGSEVEHDRLRNGYMVLEMEEDSSPVAFDAVPDVAPTPATDNENKTLLTIDATLPLADEKPFSVLTDRTVIIATSSYGLLAMAYILLDETVPLLLKQDVAHGGMSFTSSEIGVLLSVSGAMLLVFSSLFLSKIVTRSKIWLFRVFNYAAIPVILAYPLIGLLNKVIFSHYDSVLGQRMLWLCLVSLSTLRNIIATLAFTGVVCFIFKSTASNNCAGDYYGESQCCRQRSWCCEWHRSKHGVCGACHWSCGWGHTVVH